MGERQRTDAKIQPVDFLRYKTWAVRPHSIVNKGPYVNSRIWITQSFIQGT